MASSMSATTATKRAEHPWPAHMLRITLGARAAWNAAFALYLLQQRSPSVALLIGLFVRYAYVDGVLAFLTAGAHLAASPRRMLWLSPIIDALTRVALVAIVAVGPGVLEVPLTAVLYLGLLATFALVDGGLNLFEGFSVMRDSEYQGHWLALSVSGTVAMTAGVVMFVAEPGVGLLRVILIILSLAHATTSAFAVPGDRRAPWRTYGIALLFLGTVALGCDRAPIPSMDSMRTEVTSDSLGAARPSAGRPLAERREAQRFLDSASVALVAGDTASAMGMLHRAAALLLVQAHEPDTRASGELLASSAAIDSYAGALARRRGTNRATLERLSARVNLAEAERHTSLASVAWSTGCNESICDELLMAVDHVERAAKDGHVVLRPRARALLAELRQLSVRLTTPAGPNVRALEEPVARLQAEIDALRRALALPYNAT